MDRSSKILVAVDTSNFEYVCIFAAASRWEKLHSDEANGVLNYPGKTDQDNLPELLNFSSFRRILKFVVQEKLEFIRSIISLNHQSEIDCATDIDFIFAIDGNITQNFRKLIYPEYKAQRDLTKKRFNIKNLKSYIHDVIFSELGLETSMGYKMIKVENCESDDIIATVMKKYTDYMTRIIISADKDFLQLKDVVQYDCWGKKVEISINGVDDEIDRKDYLLWKIIRGDLSDNIKNVFPKYGDIKSWKLVKDRDLLKRMLTESNDSVERFKRNSQLIDFRHIPEDYTNKILEIFENKMSEVRNLDEFSLEDCMII